MHFELNSTFQLLGQNLTFPILIIFNRDGYYYEHYGKFMVKPNHLANKTNANTTDSPIESDLTVNSTTIRREPTWKEFVSYLIRTPVARLVLSIFK